MVLCSLVFHITSMENRKKMSELDDILFALDAAAMGSSSISAAKPAAATSDNVPGGVSVAAAAAVAAAGAAVNVAAVGDALWNPHATAPPAWLDAALVRPLPGMHAGPPPTVAAESARCEHCAVSDPRRPTTAARRHNRCAHYLRVTTRC